MDIYMEIYIHIHVYFLIEGSLEVKLPTIWTDEKHSQEEAEPGRNSDMEKVRRERNSDVEKVRREQMQCAKR